VIRCNDGANVVDTNENDISGQWIRSKKRTFLSRYDVQSKQQTSVISNFYNIMHLGQVQQSHLFLVNLSRITVRRTICPISPSDDTGSSVERFRRYSITTLQSKKVRHELQLHEIHLFLPAGSVAHRMFKT
jgi:hypothetical protein